LATGQTLKQVQGDETPLTGVNLILVFIAIEKGPASLRALSRFRL